MKKSLALGLIAVIAAIGAQAQTQLGTFKSAFDGLSTAMASSMALNSTLGSNWSDAYVGDFPHLGVGATVGLACMNASPITDLTSKLNIPLSSSITSILSTYGFPIPAVNASLKLGLPIIPLDIGVKVGYLPSSWTASMLSQYGMSVDYQSIGAQLRYALIKQDAGLLPNVSVGLAYNYLKGGIGLDTGMGSSSYTVPTDKSTATTISMSSPKMALSWSANTIDVTAQVSKKLLILVPYAGAGLTVGTSSVTSGLQSTVATNYPGGLSALNQYLASNSAYSGLQLSEAGILSTASSSTPVVRLYGGISLNILLVVDAQVVYVPSTKDLGASVMARLQL